MPNVCVFALQRSGTNFIEQCILKNFKDIKIVNLASNYIWKHDYCEEKRNVFKRRFLFYETKDLKYLFKKFNF